MRISFIILCAILLTAIPFKPAAQPQISTLDSLHALISKAKNDSSKAALYLQVGDQYDLSIIDSAFIYYKKALDLNQDLKIPSLQIRASNLLAGLYNKMGDYPSALKIILDNLKLEEQLHDTNGIFITKREIIWTYGNMGDHQKALETTRDLWEFINSGYFKDETKILLYKRVIYHNLGNIFQELKQLDSSLHYRHLAYHSVAKQNKTAEWLALTTFGLENTFREIGNIDSSFFYNRLCQVHAAEAGRIDIERRSRFQLAYLYRKKGQFDSAFKYAYRGLYEFRAIPDTPGMILATLALSELFKEKKQFDSAYTYLAFNSSLKDIMFTNEKMQKAQHLFFSDMMQTKQIEQERKEAQQEYRSRLKIYSLLAGLVAMLVIAVILYRNNKHKHAAKRKIEEAYDNLKSTQAQLIQSEKMASLGELTAGIAHEIQNPLNFVNNFSEVNTELIEELVEEADKGNVSEVKTIAKDIKENEQKINHHGKRADAIVKSMLQHSRTSSGQKELTDINALADEYLRLAYHGLRAKDKSFNATFKTDFDNRIGNINIIPQDIGRVIMNLLTNAFYAVNEKKKQQHPLTAEEGTKASINVAYEPTVTVTTRRLIASENSRWVIITVKDNGNGIPASAKEKIFQPFFTTKPTGQGTGLGLSLSYDIITKGHGGEISMETSEEGTTFNIRLHA